MKRWELLGEAQTPDGVTLTLTRHDREFVIMADGKSLEKFGVIPDELVLPSPADMRDKRDPVMSRAAALAGVQLTPEKAGSLFPIEWRK